MAKLGLGKNWNPRANRQRAAIFVALRDPIHHRPRFSSPSVKSWPLYFMSLENHFVSINLREASNGM
jgi:hypothetical protein